MSKKANFKFKIILGDDTFTRANGGTSAQQQQQWRYWMLLFQMLHLHEFAISENRTRTAKNC